MGAAKNLLSVLDACVWMLLPLLITIIVTSTAGKMPGKPEKDDMMPHGEMKKFSEAFS